MVKIDVTVRLRSPLNIGSGAQQGTLAQRGMLKDREGWPYIPASTLKGRWRHAVEQVAGSLAGQTACLTHQDMCRRQLCSVCQIFGSPWQSGRVRFVNLALSGPPAIMAMRRKKLRPKTAARTGIAVNRRRGVAQDDFLFSTELFMPGVPLAFSGIVQGVISREQAALLVAGLHLIPALGRSKTGGLGRIEAEATVSDGEENWTAAQLAQALSPEGGE